jgi:lambda family phage tail tape measure protein
MSDIAAVNQVVIEGTDNTGPASDSAVKNIGRVGTAANGMGVQFQVASDALKSLGEGNTLGALEGPLRAIGGAAGAASLAVVGVAAALLALAKSTADSVNELRVLAAQAGTTGLNFLALKTMASEAGVEGGKMAMMLARLSEQMALAEDPASKAAYVFQQLGVSINNADGSAKDSALVMVDLLDKISKLGTAREKMAALTDEFGLRNARILLPMLEDANGNYDKMLATIRELGAAPSDKLTAQALAYKKATEEAGLAFDGLKNTVLPPIIDYMTTMAARMVSIASAAKDFASWIGGAFSPKVMEGLALINRFNPITAISSAIGFAGSLASPAAAAATAASSSQADAPGVGGMGDVPASAYVAQAVAAKRAADEAKAAAEQLALLKVAEAAARAETHAFNAEMMSLAATMDKANGVDSGTSNYDKTLAKIADAAGMLHPFSKQHQADMLDLAQAADDAVRAEKDYTDALKIQAEAEKLVIEFMTALNKVTAEASKATQTYNDKIADQVSKYAIETESIGLSSSAIKLLAENRKIDIDLRAVQEKLTQDLVDLDRLETAALTDQTGTIALLLDAKRAQIAADMARANGAAAAAKVTIAADIQAQDSFSSGWAKAIASYEDGLTGAKTAQTAFNSLTSSMETLFVNMANHATNAWQTFKNSILQAIEQIAAKLALSGIFQLLGFTGSAGGIGGITSLFSGSGSSGGIFGNLFGNLPSFGTALENIGTGFSTFTTLLDQGAGVVASFGSAVAGLGPSFLSVLGPIGLVAGLAIPFLSSLFSKGGGPKQGGEAGLNYYASEVSPTNNAIIQSTVDALGTSYNSMLASLGGKGTATFGLGYDTDPQGTAQNRISSSATVGGQNVYSTRDVNVGRDDPSLQAGLTLEAQRVVLAALKGSKLPDDIAKLFSTIDVPTATTAQITAIEKTAATYALINDTLASLPPDVQKHFTDMLDGTQKTADAVLVVVSIIRTFGDAIVGIGPKLTALDPASLNAFVDALGGAAAATAAFAYLGQNFLTTADRLAQSTKTLNADFINLGVTIPTSHQQFLDLLNSFDLTTDAGRQMYASVLALAPLFVTVHGTADQAATSINGVSQALSGVALSAQSFFDANFYTTAEQAEKKHKQELLDVMAATLALGVAIPISVEGFRNLIESIDRTTPAGEKLYEALIVLAPEIFDLAGGATAAATGVNAVNTALSNLATNPYVIAAGSVQQTVDTFMAQIATLAGQMASADVGGQLALQIKLVAQKILALKDQSAAAADRGDLYSVDRIFTPEIALLDQQNVLLAGKLADFTVLTAQYGSAMATQLLALEDWYSSQKTALAGNAEALGALAGIFKDKWNAIIAGTSTGVSNTIAALQKIADYLKSLQISTISPLTPLQKLSTAGSAFESDFTKAQGGDATALGNITADADAYLKLARDAYASSQTYTDIFNRVTQELAGLAGTDTSGQPRVVTSDPFPALTGALPSNGSKLASQADLAAQTAAIIDALAAHADAGTADAGTITTAVARGAVLVVDAVNSGSR